jgi:hypothetical protein
MVMAVSTPITQRLKPLAQRRRDLADQITALQGQLRIAQGIQVLHVASCGHSRCGAPMPAVLPADAWVVLQGCLLETPKEVTPEVIKQQVEMATPLTAQQQADHRALLELAQQFEPIRTITVVNR